MELPEHVWRVLDCGKYGRLEPAAGPQAGNAESVGDDHALLLVVGSGNTVENLEDI